MEWAEGNQSALQQLVAEFSRQLTSSAGSEIEYLGAMLGTVCDRMQALTTDLMESQRQTQQMMDEAARGLRDSFATSSTQAAEGIERTMRMVAAQLEAVTQQLVANLSGAGADMRDSGRVVAERIAEAVQLFLGGASVLERLMKTQLDSAQRVMEDTVRFVRESVAASSTEVAERLERSMQEVGLRLGEVSQQLATKAADAGAEMRRAGLFAAERMGEVAGHFSQGAAQMERWNHFQAELMDRFEKVGSSLDAAGAAVAEAHRSFVQVVEPARALVTDLDLAARRVDESLKGTAQLVERVASAGAK